VDGGGWRRESYDFFSLPLWVRNNSIIPVGSQADRPDYDFADNVTFHLFEPAEGTTQVTVPDLQGRSALTFTVGRTGSTLQIEAAGAVHAWQVLLRGVETIAGLTGGQTASDEAGLLLKPDEGVAALTVEL
ncbi:MAG: hypothetical protein KDE59_29325, partial [Anaerolineales bacterium]|nr:hypothetical protein [Anaerolineales bacterium]